ncbi:TdeIII family type II restriction endonuclease [Schnuerera ultunensis]|uniref:TdeIII family type II restriction endonuclease n=1 Tax=Schnuerera ultunensis TaxID=45497 RepID=UPI00040BFF0B|nr:TdeIII family type II restriction endonuclease [Schnuerera ultunensis]
MELSKDKVEKLSHLIINVLFKRFESFPDDSIDNRNAPFHEAFLKAFSDKFHGKVVDIPFFISLSSWLHGLNTTLGQTFFEGAAHILSDGEKREYTSKKLGNLQISKDQKANINSIMTELSNSTREPNLIEENKILFMEDFSEKDNANDFSCDVFIEDIDKIIAIELKSVKPNSGEMAGEKRKILEGKTALFENFPGKRVSFYMGFPFDPTAEKPFEKNKDRFMDSIINCNKYFDDEEILLGDELWDFLSGTSNTMQQLITIINTIATTDFLDKYNFINDKSNRPSDKYKEYLKTWNLFSELELLKKDNIIKEKIKGNNRLTRIYNQQVFKKEKYNWDRYNALEGLVE